ncbi:MAG: glycosyltransferase family 2 protein [Patescibacteria group bacterium]
MDSDGQHKPEDISRFIEKLEKDNLDIVFGSRRIGKDMPLVMMLGNKFLSLSLSLLFKIYISDTQSGFRAIRSSVYPKIKWNSTRYAVETEMIVNASKNKLKFGEIEIQTIYRDNYKGTTIFDGLRIFYNILMWRII